MKRNILLLHCPDRPGIIADITNFLAAEGANTMYLEQHVDREQGQFFMRLEYEYDSDTLPLDNIKQRFTSHISAHQSAQWELYDAEQTPNVAVFVSKYDHCLYDILSRHASGELSVAIPLIVSNHDTLKPIADQFNIPFVCIKVTSQNKAEAEAKQIEHLRKHNIDLVVLARYMQILSPDFVSQFPNQIINIHHSFLPAFPGAKPYHSAYERGVKIIGATSHYVTSDLDEGPIIEQEVVRVSHIHNIPDFIRMGRDLEKLVLSRAIAHHIQHKVLVYANKTVVFS